MLSLCISMYKDLFRPTYLQELCKKYNLSPSKKYGQNYLITDSPVKKMLEAADLKKSDIVVEIGPGFGVLTFALTEKVKKVLAFEIEKKLEKYWQENSSENLEVIWGNVLNKIEEESKKFKGYKVVANLPYQITSNILRTLLELENKPESITVMVQREVADRIVAKPGDMSMLAVSVQYYGQSKKIAKVSKGNFWPSPKVDSAVLHITTRPPNHSTTFTDKEFFEVVRVGFANKRKQLWRNLAVGLKIEAEQIKHILNTVTGNEKIRAEELLVEQWKEITDILNTKNTKVQK